MRHTRDTDRTGDIPGTSPRRPRPRPRTSGRPGTRPSRTSDTRRTPGTRRPPTRGEWVHRRPFRSTPRATPFDRPPAPSTRRPRAFLRRCSRPPPPPPPPRPPPRLSRRAPEAPPPRASAPARARARRARRWTTRVARGARGRVVARGARGRVVARGARGRVDDAGLGASARLERGRARFRGGARGGSPRRGADHLAHPERVLGVRAVTHAQRERRRARAEDRQRGQQVPPPPRRIARGHRGRARGGVRETRGSERSSGKLTSAAARRDLLLMMTVLQHVQRGGRRARNLKS